MKIPKTHQSYKIYETLGNVTLFMATNFQNQHVYFTTLLRVSKLINLTTCFKLIVILWSISKNVG